MITRVTAAPRWQCSSASGIEHDSWRVIWNEDGGLAMIELRVRRRTTFLLSRGNA